MPILTNPIRHIDNTHELFVWLIERIEECEPFIEIPTALDERCRAFAAQLVKETTVFPPVTRNSILRAIRNEQMASTDRVRRSVASLRFLGAAGTRLEEDEFGTLLWVDDIITGLAKAWPRNEDYLLINDSRDDVFAITSKGRATLKLDIMISAGGEYQLGYLEMDDAQFVDDLLNP